MDPLIIAAALAAFFAAAFLKGVCGLGFATSCLGFMALFLDPRASIPLVIVPSMASNLLVMYDAGNFRAVFKRFLPLYLSALPGLFVGLWALSIVDPQEIRLALGIILALYGVWALWQGVLLLPERMARALTLPVGLASGFVNGMTGSQIMPILPYLLSLGLDKNTLVQSINTSFTISSCIMLVGLGRLGFVDGPVLLVSALGIPVVGLGIFLGGRIRRRVSEERFRKVVLVMLVVLGASLAWRALAAL